MGSELPGGYSTVSIRPSLPGRSVRSFDRSCVTLASCAPCATCAPDMRHAMPTPPDMRHASAKISFANVINYLRLSDAIQCVVCIGRYFAVTRVPHEFLFAAQPIFDVVAV